MRILNFNITLLLTLFAYTISAQEITPNYLERSQTFTEPSDASELPTILQDLSFLEQNTIVFEEIVYYEDYLHHATNAPSVDYLKVAFYDSNDHLLFKASFSPSYLIARRLENGEVGYYFEGVAYELESDTGEIFEAYDRRYLADSVREPSLSIAAYIGLNSNVVGEVNFNVSQHPGHLGQIWDIITGAPGLPEAIFDTEYSN